ncbi:MAG TPA: GTPase Era [Acholeplasmataceae bacterium]|nr:GTPase Era [Acholeplasmataceae bacterium]HRX44683.1 GTPase Era [Acholeplasmataceae bacterium]
MTKTYRSGFVAIVGRPNVGKSTLINALIGEKIAIMSPKPQTTRHRIMGVLSKEDYQIVFVDTPGLHKGKDLLNKTIDKIAVSAISDVDVVLYVVDRAKDASSEYILNYFKQAQVPVFLVINKIDTLKNKSQIDDIILSYLSSYPFEGVIPISAKEHTYLDKIEELVVPLLEEGPQFFPEEMTSDQTEEQLMSELIREKILYHTEQEVPHAVAVVIESLQENDEQNTIDVSALIIVERATQKQILIGKGGEKMKKIGMEARKEINQLLNTKIHLTLWVKVKKDWRNRPGDLRSLGFSEDI